MEKVLEDRRGSARVSCRLDIKSKTEKNWFLLNSMNISMSGIMLTCDTDLEKLKELGIDTEKEVFLSFYLPNESHLVKVSGRIKHIKRKTDSVDKIEASFVGIQFKDVPEQITKYLETFVSCNEIPA